MLTETDDGVLRKRDLVVRVIDAFDLSIAIGKAQASAPSQIGFPLVWPIDLHLQRIVPCPAARYVKQDVADPVTETAARAASTVRGDPKVRKIEDQVVVSSRADVRAGNQDTAKEVPQAEVPLSRVWSLGVVGDQPHLVARGW